MECDEMAAARLRDLLSLPMPQDEFTVGAQGYFDPWDAFDGIVGAYNSTIDAVAIKTLEAIRDKATFDLLDSKHGLFVEFFLHILAGHGYVEYGTSPRGPWPTHTVGASHGTDALWGDWIARWREWYRLQWGEDVDAQ